MAHSDHAIHVSIITLPAGVAKLALTSVSAVASSTPVHYSLVAMGVASTHCDWMQRRMEDLASKASKVAR